MQASRPCGQDACVMQMIDVYAAEGAFTDKHSLARDLAQAEAALQT
jgi:hypothetical protein